MISVKGLCLNEIMQSMSPEPNVSYSNVNKIIEFMQEPLIIPVYSALVGVLITFIYQWVRGLHKYRQARRNTFLVLHTELNNHKKLLEEFKTNLGDGEFVHPKVDEYSIRNFLESNYMNISEDSSLVKKLHIYLQTVSTLNSAIGRLDLLSAGWVNVQTEKRIELEKNIKKIMPDTITEIDECLVEIEQRNII